MARHYRNGKQIMQGDPLTYVHPRYPHEHATPADYAQSIEGHKPDTDGDWLQWFAVAASIVSVSGVIVIVLFERFAS
jgi:hypothetical protein